MKKLFSLLPNLIPLLLSVVVLLCTVSAQGAICSKDNWCWVSEPPESGVWSKDIWGSSEKDIFSVGGFEGGSVSGSPAFRYIDHYNGTAWSSMLYEYNYPLLLSVWGSSGSDVFAVGPSSILHYDGSKWSYMQQNSPPIWWYSLSAVWGSSGSDVFAVGNGGTILHYDGSKWIEMNSGTESTLNGVWGSSGSDVFAVGNGGTILHYDGNTWSAMFSGTTENLKGIWGSSGNYVIVVGDTGTALWYNGSNWIKMKTGTNASLWDVWGSGPRDIYAVGSGCSVFHHDGHSWVQMAFTCDYVSSNFYSIVGIWGSDENNVYILTRTGFYRRQGGGHPPPPPIPRNQIQQGIYLLLMDTDPTSH